MKKKRIVYTTDQGNLCPDCRQPVSACQCQDTAPAGDSIIRLHRQTRGRRGKAVTLITGLPLTGTDLKAVARELKNRFGVGGAIEGPDILIQGDQREVIKPLLEAQGYTVKLAGG